MTRKQEAFEIFKGTYADEKRIERQEPEGVGKEILIGENLLLREASINVLKEYYSDDDIEVLKKEAFCGRLK